MKPVAPSFVAVALMLSACVDLRSTPNDDYCGNNDGDAYCQRTFGADKPYCVADTPACFDEALLPTACVAELPVAECRNECGMDSNCVDPTDPTVASSSSSSGETTGDTETDPSGETDTETTTGPMGCQGSEDCTEPANPFCVDEACVACSGTADGDASCAELDPTVPLCLEDACVQCTAENADACGGATPLCDAEANTCVPCRFHEDCQGIGPACNFITGACFDPANVSEVNAASSGAIQGAIDGVADGAEHAIVVTGSAGVSHNVTVDGGKVIAIVSANESSQTVAGLAGAPTLTVAGGGSTVFLHRLRLSANTDDVGVLVGAGGTLYADAVQVGQNTGGGIVLDDGATAQLRNCMVAANVNTDVVSNSGVIDILYSTLIGNGAFGGNTSLSLSCSGGATTVRNSILASRADDAVDCPGASIEVSVRRTAS